MSKPIQPHIMCSEVAPYVLVPGDPGRAEKAASFFDKAEKASEYRGFVTYTGSYRGIPVSATSTGIGCPSAMIVIEELIKAGAKTLIRIGTCGSLQPHIDLGDIVVATAAARTDGATTAYVPVELPAVADFEVTSALIKAAEELGVKVYMGTVWCSSAFYAESPDLVKLWNSLGVLAVEMETSGLFTISSLRKARSGAILAVDGNLILGKKKGEFKPGEEAGELDPRVKKAIDDEIKVALRAIEILEEKARSRG